MVERMLHPIKSCAVLKPYQGRGVFLYANRYGGWDQLISEAIP